MLSVADAEKVTGTELSDVVVVVTGEVGTVTTGGVVSMSVTCTVKLLLPVLPCASVAEQFTVVEPTGKLEPDEGLQLGVRAPSRSSVAEAE